MHIIAFMSGSASGSSRPPPLRQWYGHQQPPVEEKTSDFIKIKVMNITKGELIDDFSQARESDHSALFRRLLDEEPREARKPALLCAAPGGISPPSTAWGSTVSTPLRLTDMNRRRTAKWVARGKPSPGTGCSPGPPGPAGGPDRCTIRRREVGPP